MLFNIGNLADSGAGALNIMITLVAYLIVIVMSLSLHEFAHGFAAYKNGDPTPKMQGRITINPFKHIDTMGFICCVLFGFGWAKPVAINPNNFRNIKKGIGWTSIAGVLMNLILAFVGCGFYAALTFIGASNIFSQFLTTLFYYLFFINVCLAVFNFLPIYPLDGFKFVENYTRYNNGYVQFMRKYGSMMLILLIVFFDSMLISLINYVAYPIMWFWNLIF